MIDSGFGYKRVVIDVESHLLNNVYVYGFELIDEKSKSILIKPFITENHPIVTNLGVCSINPTASKLEYPNLSINELKSGIKLLYNNKFCKISKVYKEFLKEVIVYNLITTDQQNKITNHGNDKDDVLTYVANNFIVCD